MSAARNALAAYIAACRRCPGLNVKGVTGSAPGYGCETSPVMLVGQSLCRRCMATGVPFTGGSEWLITRALDRAGPGLVKADRLLVKADLFVTNVVHCHPPDDRKSEQHEKDNCRRFLRRELALVRPTLVVALGDDAGTAIRNEYRRALIIEWRRYAPSPVLPANGPMVLRLPHPSNAKFWPAPERQEWVDNLAAALRWGFSGR